MVVTLLSMPFAVKIVPESGETSTRNAVQWVAELFSASIWKCDYSNFLTSQRKWWNTKILVKRLKSDNISFPSNFTFSLDYEKVETASSILIVMRNDYTEPELTLFCFDHFIRSHILNNTIFHYKEHAEKLRHCDAGQMENWKGESH